MQQGYYVRNGQFLPGVSGSGRKMAGREMPDGLPHEAGSQRSSAENQSAEGLQAGKQEIILKGVPLLSRDAKNTAPLPFPRVMGRCSFPAGFARESDSIN